MIILFLLQSLLKISIVHLHKNEAYKEQIQSTLESDNPWVAMMMKSIGADPSIKKSMTDEAIDGMIDSMLGAE